MGRKILEQFQNSNPNKVVYTFSYERKASYTCQVDPKNMLVCASVGQPGRQRELGPRGGHHQAGPSGPQGPRAVRRGAEYRLVSSQMHAGFCSASRGV